MNLSLPCTLLFPPFDLTTWIPHSLEKSSRKNLLFVPPFITLSQGKGKESHTFVLLSHFPESNQVIRQGGQGIVACYESSNTKQRVVAKVTYKHSKELEVYQFLMRHLKEDNSYIVTLFAFGCIDIPEHGKLNVFIMEYLQSDLMDLMLHNPIYFTYEVVREILYYVACALSQCHKMGIIYSDLKPDNILHCPKTHITKLTDFNLSIVPNQITTNQHKGGTFSYMSPQLQSFYKKSTSSCQPLMADDVWAFGILTFVLLTRTGSPFTRTSVLSYHQIRKQMNTLFNHCLLKIHGQQESERKQALHFLNKTLVFDRKNRKYMPDFLYHPFLNKKK